MAFESQAVKNMIEDTGMDHPIPLPNVSSKILAKVIEYCKYHVDNQKAGDDKPATSEDEIKAWDLDFVKVDQATLFDLILVSCVFCNTFSFPGFACAPFVSSFICDMTPVCCGRYLLGSSSCNSATLILLSKHWSLSMVKLSIETMCSVALLCEVSSMLKGGYQKTMPLCFLSIFASCFMCIHI